MNNYLDKIWSDCEFVAFDTETSGAYPVGSDIVEFGAVKWRGGHEIATKQLLIKPRELMSSFIIGIHGITNQMVENSPPIQAVIGEIREFLGDSVLLAHHAPFDMGFVAYDLERYQQSLPSGPVLCTSLLSRQLIRHVENHRLQTLVKTLNLNGGSAHRALDDARACLQVAMYCFKLMGPDKNISDALKIQNKKIIWENFLFKDNQHLKKLEKAILLKLKNEIVYGSDPEKRIILPQGIVRNPDGDYVQAICERDNKSKRFKLEKIKFIDFLHL